MHPARDQRAHGFGSVLRVEDTAAHHGPAGRVVMDVSGVDNRDIKARIARLETGRDRDPPSARPHDHHVIAGIPDIRGGLAPIGDPARHTVHVITRSLCGGENFGHGSLARLSKGP